MVLDNTRHVQVEITSNLSQRDMVWFQLLLNAHITVKLKQYVVMNVYELQPHQRSNGSKYGREDLHTMYKGSRLKPFLPGRPSITVAPYIHNGQAYEMEPG